MGILLFLLTAALATGGPVNTVDEDSISTVALTGPYLGQTPPTATPELFAPGIISTGKEHSSAMFTPDGAEVWFARMFPAQVWYCRQDDGVWGEPQVAPFSIEDQDLYPYLAPDGNALYFCTRRGFEGLPPLTSKAHGRVCVALRSEGGWIGPRPLGPELNYSNSKRSVASASNGNLYLSARSESGATSMDLYLFRISSGTIDPADTFTEIISSPTPDHSPFIAPDESYLIFSSFRGGPGLSDLFISFRTEDTSWTKPVSLGPKINSPYKEEYPYVSPDGKYLFFNSNRPSALNATAIPDGPGNIYWLEARFIEDLRSRSRN